MDLYIAFHHAPSHPAALRLTNHGEPWLELSLDDARRWCCSQPNAHRVTATYDADTGLGLLRIVSLGASEGIDLPDHPHVRVAGSAPPGTLRQLLGSLLGPWVPKRGLA